jgi:uridine kinase
MSAGSGLALIPVELPWTKTEVVEGTTVDELFDAGPTEGRDVVAACVNDRVVALDFPIECPSRVQPIDTASREGEEVVRRTATLLLHGVARRLFPKARLHVGQSLRGGYHYGVSGEHPAPAELAAALDEAFHREADAGRQVVRQEVSIDAALLLFEQEGEPLKVRLLRIWPSHRVPLVSCLGFTDIRHGPYALSVRPCRSFHVEAHEQGLLLVFDGQDGQAERLEGGTVLFNAYKETKRWNELVGVGTVPDLNDQCLGDRIKHVIRIAEGQHEKKIAELADRIAARRDELRVVCIAGPSSSGKTTFVKRLSIQLEVNGIVPRTLSLDDYYVDREKTPLDEDGDYDFEALEAIDLPLFLPQLKELVEGREVVTPVYDFKAGMRKPESGWRHRRLGENEVLLIEGIHALNPRLTESVGESRKFRIFINALTQLCIDDHNRIRTSDARLLRRIVRDRRYRGYSAETTILRWPKVRAGEEKHIFPFQERCDAMFNSALAYETAVLKSFADRYLLEVPPVSPAQARGYQLRRFLELFVPVWPDDVPATSILREFIGGSGFSYK